jgi:hypothetical protein
MQDFNNLRNGRWTELWTRNLSGRRTIKLFNALNTSAASQPYTFQDMKDGREEGDIHFIPCGLSFSHNLSKFASKSLLTKYSIHPPNVLLSAPAHEFQREDILFVNLIRFMN